MNNSDRHLSQEFRW